MAVVVPNTVPSDIVALRGLTQRPFTSEAKLVPLLAALVNVRTTAGSWWLWPTTANRHQTRAVHYTKAMPLRLRDSRGDV